MVEPPIELDGIRATQSADDPAVFVYDSGDPGPERGPQGHPSFQLLSVGEGAFLQLGARWGADAARLEALREEIARRLGTRPAMVRLSPLEATVEEVRLELADGASGFRQIASSTSSRVPPFTALFSTRLDRDQSVIVTEAAAGREGRLRVIYRLSLAETVTAESEIAGDVSEEVAALARLGTAATLGDASSLIDDALAAGRLTWRRSATDGASALLRERADLQARSQAAELLLRMDRHPSAATRLETTARLKEPVQSPAERSTDVGSWFASKPGETL